MMGRMGDKESFQEARGDIAKMAGIQVETKAVETSCGTLGAEIEVLGQSERRQAMGENVVTLKAVTNFISVSMAQGCRW